MSKEPQDELSGRESPIDAQLASPPPRDSIEQGTNVMSKLGMSSLTQSRPMVLAILFGVTGVLGIPLLWMNSPFSTAERIFWSIAVTIYTAVLIGITGKIVMWSYRTIMG